MKTDALSILCIDDDQLHIELLRKAASHNAKPMKIHALTNGGEALRWLRENGNHPDVILLDGVMPGREGLSVLKELKTDARLKIIPVLMLSGISEVKHIRDSYAGGANLYFVKPTTLAGYTKLAALFVELWSRAELPGAEAPEPVNVVR